VKQTPDSKAFVEVAKNVMQQIAIRNQQIAPTETVKITT